MKKVTLNVFLFVLLAVLSCKNEKKEDTTTTETQTNMSSDPFFKLSLAQWSFHIPIQKGLMDPMDFAKKSKALGFDVVEYVDQLYTLDSTLPYKEGVNKLALEWKEENEKHDIKPGLIMIDTAGELADPSEDKRKEAIEKHKNWIDVAHLIGAPAVRVNLFGLTQPKAWHEACVASLKELGAYASKKDIKVLPENHAQLSNDPNLMLAVIKEVNLPAVGILPDFGNFCIEREGGERWGPAKCINEYDRYKGISQLLEFAGGVSAKSYDFDEKGDETTIDYYKMMKIVKDSGFSGYIGVEYENEVLEDASPGILATKDLLLKAAKALK